MQGPPFLSFPTCFFIQFLSYILSNFYHIFYPFFVLCLSFFYPIFTDVYFCTIFIILLPERRGEVNELRVNLTLNILYKD